MDQQGPGADEGRDGRPEDAQPDEGVLGEIQPEEPPEVPSAESPRQSRRRRSRLIGCLLAVLGALAGGAVAWWISSDVEVQPDPPDAEMIVPADDGYGQPANRLVFSPTPERPDQTPEIISAETSVIYCFYDLGRIPADASLAATWSHDGEPLGDLPLAGHVPDEGAEHARGRFTLRPPPTQIGEDRPSGAAEPFPAGIYEVEVTSPEYPDVSATGSFVALPRAAQILHGGGEPEGPPAIRSLHTATGVTEDGEPVGRSASFSSDTERITAVFTYRGVPPGSVLTVRWHLVDHELTDARTEIAVTAAEGWAEAWLETQQTDGLPPGDYRVTVHLGDDDEPLASTGFSVADATEHTPAP